ncbi:hypothetical protein Pcinc_028394 [Petrolisthes cinctipes]|uniref:C2H2-type domain-containing protein n=1 Tax=Petrolisthes cinctipes TaxID=88211 RepID=A0AAE1F346_PETCI|nr:hypothetical protein Pcinc_028394 [Petrolisthes cinctipes]
MEADLSRVLANLHQDIADLQYLQQQATTRAPTLVQQQPHLQQPQQLLQQPPRDASEPGIRSMQHEPCRPVPQLQPPRDASEPGIRSMQHEPCSRPVPQPRTHNYNNQQQGISSTTTTTINSSLRHTQSEVVGRVIQSSRPRALSTGATINHQTDYHNPYHHQQQYPPPPPSSLQTPRLHQHGYVNLQPRSMGKFKPCSQRPTSSYDNVPTENYSMLQISHSSMSQKMHVTQSTGDVFMPSKCTSSLSMKQSVTSMPPPPSVTHMPTPRSQSVTHMPPTPQSQSVTHMPPPQPQSVTHMPPPQPQSVTHMPPPQPQSVTHMPPPQPAIFIAPPPPPSTPTLFKPQTACVPTVPQSSTPFASGQRYMNVPLSVGGLSPVPAPANNSGQSGCGSNSAPPTPQHKSAPHRLHHSYIELWSGVCEERDSLSDSECEELKRSLQKPQTPSSTRPSPGYVEMSSPYIKSPQVTSPFTGSVLADFASRLAFYAGHQPRNIFCPFCPRYFGYEKSLGSHIHKAHRTELNTMVESGCCEVKLQLCPICQAQFFNTSVLPKHLIDFHRASVVEILEKNSCIISDAVGIQCPFCSKKVPHGKTGEQVLLYHMQQLHLSQYEEMIKVKFQPTCKASLESIGNTGTKGSGESAVFQPGITSTPGLSNRLANLAVQTRSRRSVEALDLDTTWSSHTATNRPTITTLQQQYNSEPTNVPNPALNNNPTNPMLAQDNQKTSNKQLTTCASKGILRHQSALGRKPSVKRELRFSVPPVTSEEIFIPESPQQDTPERCLQHKQSVLAPPPPQQQHTQQTTGNGTNKRVIPVRVDSLSAADFMDLNEKCSGQRKRRRLGLGLRSRKAFKKKDKENIGDLASGVGRVVDGAKKCLTEGLAPAKEPIISTMSTRTFRRPKPVAIPRVPQLPPVNGQHTGQHGEETTEDASVMGREQVAPSRDGESNMIDDAGSDTSRFTHLKLYSPLRMFRCNGCRVKFCDNESLGSHITSKHRGLLCLLRPQYGCGVCSAKFFENKYLVKHCLQHHTSLLEIRSPTKQKITLYRFTHE